MAEIDRFNARAPRGGSVSGLADTGATDTWAALASTSGQIANRLGRMADRQAAREGREAGAAAAAQIRMPGVDFAFQDGSPGMAGTPGRYSPAGTPSAAPLTGSLADRAAFARQYLETRHGLPSWKAAGIVGNGVQESNLRPTGAVGDNGTAFGAFQWRHERFTNLKRFAASTGRSWETMETQLDFVMHELGTTEKSAGRKFAAARNVTEATAAIISFERPAGWTPQNPTAGHGWSKRLKHAQAALGLGESRASEGTPAASVAASADTGDAGIYEAGKAGTPGTPPAISVSLTPGGAPPARMQPGTIRGDAYNEAALGMHLDRLETAMAGQMDAVAIENRDDPAALTSALDALRQGYKSGLAPQEAALVDGAFERRKMSLVREATRGWQKNFEAEREAVFEETLASRHDNALRIARIAGTDPEADKALAAEMSAIDQAIGSSGMNPAEQGRLRRKLESDVLSTRILGGFDNQGTAEDRTRFAERFQEEWRNGEGFGGKVNVETFDRITADMTRRLEADRAASEKRSLAIDKEINGQLSLLKKGYPVPDDRRQALRSAVATSGDPALASNLDFLDGLANWQRGHLGSRPEVVGAQITALKDRIAAEGATPNALAALDVMESLQTEMGAALKSDPLTWANRAGVAAVEPLDFSDQGSMIASLTERASDAEAIAGHYGVAPRYFTPAETTALTRALDAAPENLPAIASSMIESFGPATPLALKEISTEAPVVAHVAGLMQATGEQRVAVEVAEALAYRKLDGYQKQLPPPAQLGDATATTLGGALTRMPQVRAAATQTAQLLFEARARRLGVPIDDFDMPGSEAAALYANSLDEVLGGRTVADVKYGGLTSVNGATTVAPATLPADELEAMVLNLSDADLATQPPIVSANGIPLTARALRAGKLVWVGEGRYQMMLGDAADPRFVMTRDARPWILDVRQLGASQSERGVDAYGEALAPGEMIGRLGRPVR